MAKDPRKTETTLPTRALVTRQFRASGKDVGEPDQTEEIIEIHKFATEPAQVNLGLGLTINLGNFEFVRADVSMTVPCYKEEADAAFEYARAWVEERTLAVAGTAEEFARKRKSTEPDDPF